MSTKKKPHRTKPLTVYVEPQLDEALRQEALRDDRTISGVAVRILRAALMPPEEHK